MPLEFKGHNLHTMDTYINRFSQRFTALEHWFDKHFGWFFTNGMKEKKQNERLRPKA